MADELHGVKRKMLDFSRQCGKLKEERASLIKRLAGGINGTGAGRVSITGGGGAAGVPEDLDDADAVISGVLNGRDATFAVVSTRPSTARASSGRSKFVGGGFNITQSSS